MPADRLVCRRPRPFTRHYDLFADDQAIGWIDFSDPLHGALEVDGRELRARCEGDGSFRVEHEGGVVAEARRDQAQPLSLRISSGDREWRIAGSRKKPLRFELEGAGGESGVLKARLGLLSNSLSIGGQLSASNEVLAFLCWLVGIHWPGIVGAVGASRVKRAQP